jgi:AcrR family transcriptional regulator
MIYHKKGMLMLTEKQREDIWQAANTCLKETGLEKMTLAKVARKSGIPESKIKEDYKDKNNLIQTMMTAGIDHVTNLLEKSINARGKPDVKLYRFIKSLLDDYENHDPLFRLVSINFDSLNSESLYLRNLVTQDQIDRYRRNTAIIARIIAEGQSEGIFRKADPLECAFFLRGIINSAILYWKATSYEGSLGDFADRVMRMFLTGIYK